MFMVMVLVPVFALGSEEENGNIPSQQPLTMHESLS
jgi:hypothetical protein